MKKIIIAAISAIAVIASVVGCQIYDSQTNETLYSSMNALGEGSMSKEDYIAKFNEDCKKLSDLSSDDLSSDRAGNIYETVIDYYFNYSDFYTTVKGILADDTGFTGDDLTDINNPSDVKAYYKEKYMPIGTLRTAIKTKDEQKNAKGVITSPQAYEDAVVQGCTISGMYDKQYQLKWDWNGKKGR